MKVSLVLPTYNERENIVLLIEEIIAQFKLAECDDFEVLVVDDDSPDGTADYVNETYGERESRVKVIVRKQDKGLAQSIKEGMRKATGDQIIVMDSDFNHDPEMIPIFLGVCPFYDIVIGSRYVTGGGMLTSQFRYWGSYIFNHIVKFILLLKTNDNLSGFFMFKRDVIDRMPMDDLVRGYGDYAIRLLFWAKLKKLSILEVPVVYKFRKGGTSKTNFWVYTWCYMQTALMLRIWYLFKKQ